MSAKTGLLRVLAVDDDDAAVSAVRIRRCGRAVEAVRGMGSCNGSGCRRRSSFSRLRFSISSMMNGGSMANLLRLVWKKNDS